MKREQYVAPVTRRFSVELEGGFTSASIVQETPQSGVTSTGQEINQIDGNDFTGVGDWNDSTWE